MNTTEATIFEYALIELEALNNAFAEYSKKPDSRTLKKAYFESVQRMGVVNELLEKFGCYIDIDGKIKMLDDNTIEYTRTIAEQWAKRQ